MKAWIAVAALCVIGSAGWSQDTERDEIARYEKRIKENISDSEAHFHLAEIYFRQNRYQDSANEFREALNGDLRPRWIEVWARINLGKIFDTTNQRERALNEYRLAKETKDNTRGAQEEAAKYSKEPYRREQ